jgi:hypothetical protein
VSLGLEGAGFLVPVFFEPDDPPDDFLDPEDEPESLTGIFILLADSWRWTGEVQ